MKFTKMHGAGNDFIIINSLEENIPEQKLSTMARKLCRQHMSIGADGIMVVSAPLDGGDYRMLFYNSDGSLGEMCGNGARCICRYGYDNGLAGETQHVETTAGLIVGQRISARQYRIRLNDPTVIDLHRSVSVLGNGYDCAYIEQGCPGLPHAVVRLDGWDNVPHEKLFALGQALRFSPAFPKGANVTFVKLVGVDCAKAVTFERGVEDFTLACGTGAGSTVSALTLLGLVSGKDVGVDMPGGHLTISVDCHGGTVTNIYLTGPTNVVCRGEICDEDLEI